ncbi:MAG: GspH/FimT family protein [Cellvibrionales bacterium]|nr:GspH/FimT family protein [Cellvibrionales bacterium]
MDVHPRHFLSMKRQGKKNQGFTLIELLVAIAILSIIIAMAAPAFTDFVARSEIRTCSITLQTDLRFAQDQARTLNKNVKLVTLTGGVDWENGYSIWVDENNDVAVGNNEQLLRQRDSMDCEIVLRQSGGDSPLIFLSFENSGMVTGLDSYDVNVCPENQSMPVEGRTLGILPSGLVQVTEEKLDCSGGA